MASLSSGRSASPLPAEAAVPPFATQHKITEQGRARFPSSSAGGGEMYSWPGGWETTLQGITDTQAAFALGSRGNFGAELEGRRREPQKTEQKVGKYCWVFFPLAPNAVGAARCPAAGTDSAPAPGSEEALKV